MRLMGIAAGRVIATAFALSGVLAGIAALLWVAQRASVDPLMGAVPVVKAFIATVVGGLGSLPGAVVGGLLLGAIEIGLDAVLPPSVVPRTSGSRATPDRRAHRRRSRARPRFDPRIVERY